MKTIAEVIEEVASGRATAETAEAIRRATEGLYECPRCARWREILHWESRTCFVCYVEEKLRRGKTIDEIPDGDDAEALHSQSDGLVECSMCHRLYARQYYDTPPVLCSDCYERLMSLGM